MALLTACKKLYGKNLLTDLRQRLCANRRVFDFAPLAETHCQDIIRDLNDDAINELRHIDWIDSLGNAQCRIIHHACQSDEDSIYLFLREVQMVGEISVSTFDRDTAERVAMPAGCTMKIAFIDFDLEALKTNSRLSIAKTDNVNKVSIEFNEHNNTLYADTEIVPYLSTVDGDVAKHMRYLAGLLPGTVRRGFDVQKTGLLKLCWPRVARPKCVFRVECKCYFHDKQFPLRLLPTGMYWYNTIEEMLRYFTFRCESDDTAQ